VCNISIDHRADVRLRAQPGSDRWVRLVIRMTGEDYEFSMGDPPGRHPIIEHAVVASDIPGSIEVDIADSTVPGSGLGTSASVMVALVSALAAAIGDPLDAGEAAAMAHSYETVTGKQSGVQDHAAAAWGGISRFDVHYPMVRRELIVPPPAARAQLAARLHTVYLGAPARLVGIARRGDRASRRRPRRGRARADAHRRQGCRGRAVDRRPRRLRHGAAREPRGDRVDARRTGRIGGTPRPSSRWPARTAPDRVEGERGRRRGRFVGQCSVPSRSLTPTLEFRVSAIARMVPDGSVLDLQPSARRA
jgi:hypothetical protein